MNKKPFSLFIVILFIFLCRSTLADAYTVTNYWTSEEGWGEGTTSFTTNTDKVYINVDGSNIPEPITGLWMRMEWYQPDGEQENDLGTNLISHPVYSNAGLLIGFWAEMAIKGMDRETGQWRVEHYAYGWQDDIKDWHKMFTQHFTISADTDAQPTYDATGDWDYSDSNSWNTCDPPDPEETGTVTLTQSGNTFTLTTDEGTIDGVVYDASYTTSETYPANAPDGTPGMLTEEIVFTLSSNSAGSGTFTATWVADNINFSCGWGNDFTLTKQVAQPGGGGGGGGG